jgi:hypothetical protein
MSYGNGGWVRVDGVGLPGPFYVRFAHDDQGRWRAVELYVDGNGEPLSSATLRLPLADLEAAVLEHGENLSSRSGVPGPDLRRLAAHYGTTWGAQTYAGLHCDRCGGPIKGRRVPEADRDVRATQNWVAESFFAQYSYDAFHEKGTRIRQVPMPKEPDPPASWAEELPPLEAPAGRRITDQFLRELTRAYAIAARNGTPPAPAIAAATGVSPRTVHKWVSTARRRGIMPPGKQGRVG